MEDNTANGHAISNCFALAVQEPKSKKEHKAEGIHVKGGNVHFGIPNGQTERNMVATKEGSNFRSALKSKMELELCEDLATSRILWQECTKGLPTAHGIRNVSNYFMTLKANQQNWNFLQKATKLKLTRVKCYIHIFNHAVEKRRC